MTTNAASNRAVLSAREGACIASRPRRTRFCMLLGATPDLLRRLLPRGLALHNQAIRNVVLVDVADVGHRFLADLLGRHVLDVLEPDVGIEPALGGFLAQL